jgi:GTP-dependent phosphoenolpyruvate carboxykinase
MEIPSYITNTKLWDWVEEMVMLCKPDQIPCAFSFPQGNSA